MSHVEITRTGNRNSVTIDGHDMSHAVSALDLSADGPDVPTLTLHIPLYEVSSFRGEARVHIDSAAREALIKLGWTPPTDDLSR